MGSYGLATLDLSDVVFPFVHLVTISEPDFQFNVFIGHLHFKRIKLVNLVSKFENGFFDGDLAPRRQRHCRAFGEYHRHGARRARDRIWLLRLRLRSGSIRPRVCLDNAPLLQELIRCAIRLPCFGLLLTSDRYDNFGEDVFAFVLQVWSTLVEARNRVWTERKES